MLVCCTILLAIYDRWCRQTTHRRECVFQYWVRGRRKGEISTLPRHMRHSLPRPCRDSFRRPVSRGDFTHQLLHMDVGQKSMLGFTVWACPQIATTADEPNNTVLCVHSVLGYTEVIAVMDNEALYSINGRNLDIERLSNTNYHRLSARSIFIAFFWCPSTASSQ